MASSIVVIPGRTIRSPSLSRKSNSVGYQRRSVICSSHCLWSDFRWIATTSPNCREFHLGLAFLPSTFFSRCAMSVHQRSSTSMIRGTCIGNLQDYLLTIEIDSFESVSHHLLDVVC